MPRYDQCDGTCTADCGHCKGPPELPADMVDRAAARLWAFDGHTSPWPPADEFDQRRFRDVARQVLTAALAHRGILRTQLGVRVDRPHPARAEKAGTVITHFPDENARRCRQVWSGWTLVRRTVIDYAGRWGETGGA